MNEDKERFYAQWQKHYLQLEVEKLEISLKYYLNQGWISRDDYQFLNVTFMMIKTFISIHMKKSNRQPHHVTWNHPSYPKKRKKPYRRRNSFQPSLFDAPKPVSITGKIEVDGLKERLDALQPRKDNLSGPKFPYKIPAGTHWNQVIIKFLNDEQIEIWVKKQRHITSYKDMKMVGRGLNPLPNEQWLFLKVLAQYNGELTIKDPEARDKYKKQKQGLSETLKNYFSIDYDPFYPYHHNPEKSGNSYKIKITLIPPPISQKNEFSSSDDELGIQDFLNEQAPQI